MFSLKHNKPRFERGLYLNTLLLIVILTPLESFLHKIIKKPFKLHQPPNQLIQVQTFYLSSTIDKAH